MVAIDNTALALLLHPKAKPPNDPKTGLPLAKAQERIEQPITESGCGKRADHHCDTGSMRISMILPLKRRRTGKTRAEHIKVTD
jgi:hypothetical protein